MHMKLFLKKNRIYIILFLVLTVVMAVMLLQDQNILDICFRWLTSSEYRKNYCFYDEDPECSVNNLADLIGNVMSYQGWHFDILLVFGTSSIQILLPLVCAVSGVLFYTRWHSVSAVELYRSGNTKQYLYRTILKEAMKTGIACFAAYLVLVALCYLWADGKPSGYVIHQFLHDFLGTEFILSHTAAYYLIEGIFRFFLMPALYSAFAQSLSLYAPNIKQAILYPCLYYYGLTVISWILKFLIGKNYIYFNPAYILVSGDYENVSSIGLLMIHLIPALFCIYSIRVHSKRDFA